MTPSPSRAASSRAYKVYLGQDSTDIPGGTVVVNYAMQFPETSSRGLSTSANAFLDGFLRGNRDISSRSGEGSLTQALSLMNDPFVMNRIRTASSGAGSLINTLLAGNPIDANW